MESKNDLNRIGLFSELGYISIGDPYKNQHKQAFNVSASKGKQMLPGGSKSRSALQNGYFSKSFDRIMEGEASSDPLKRKRQEALKKKSTFIQKPLVPNHSGKLPSGAGSHYGTFSGTTSAFSPIEKNKAAYKSPGRNFLTHPGRKGTGYGYVNVFIGKPQTHASEPYERGKELRKNDILVSQKKMQGHAFKLNSHPQAYFDGNPYKTDRPLPAIKETTKRKPDFKPFKQSSPAKEIGGSKAGCFDPYPSHSNDPYVAKKSPFREATKEQKGIFRPSQGCKSTPMRSIVNQNVDRRINSSNFQKALSVA